MSTTEFKIRTIINENEPSFFSPYDSDNYNHFLFKDYFWVPSHLKLLIKHGIDINTIDKYGKNASFYCNNLQSLKILLDHGLNLNHLDNYGRTPLFYLRNKNIIDEFLKREIDLNVIDCEGFNFLSYGNLYFSTDPILYNAKKMHTSEFPVRHLFSNSSDILLKSKHHGLTGKLSGDIILEFSPYKNPTRIKELLKQIDLGQIHIDMNTRFIAYPYLLLPETRNEYFTISDFNNF
ncbi:ankyrin repeat domain-containing protein [Lonsdalea quercina]|uniref:ankyrin repeat domain-containing protein n=1 Tax=Lonsdalea quercina TaxID=71657 RepID=UPI00397591E6